MSWLHGYPEKASHIQSSQLILNSNQYQPTNDWYTSNSKHSNILTANHLQNQNQRNFKTNSANEFYTKSISINKTNESIISGGNTHQTMTSQYFDNTAANQDGWGDWGDDFNDEPINPQTNIHNNHQTNITSQNQNAVYSQQVTHPLQYSSQQPQPQPQPQPQHQPQPQPLIKSDQTSYNSPPLILPQEPIYQQQFPIPNYQQQQQQQQSFNPTNSQQSSFQQHQQNSFQQQPPTSNNNENWNWNLEETQKTQQIPQNVDQINNYSKLNDYDNQKINYDFQMQQNPNNNIDNLQKQQQQSRIPDDLKNTHNLQNPLLSRVKRTENLLTHQWSTESQVSQTSSDRSVESDNSRSSATNTSDEPSPQIYDNNNHQIQQQNYKNHNEIENNQNLNYPKENRNYFNDFQMTQQSSVGGVEGKKVVQELDSLDEVLMNMNVGNTTETSNNLNYYQQEVATGIETKPRPVNYIEQSNVSYINSHPQESFNINSNFDTNQTESSSYNFPQQKILQNPNSNNNPSISQQQQQPFIAPPKFSAPQSQITPSLSQNEPKSNPFKRTTPTNMQRASPFQPPPTNFMPTNNFHPDPIQNQENFISIAPDNSEIIENRNISEIENHEIAPTNERNQYLQTGHLSEDGQIETIPEINLTSQPEIVDNLPPPGLSRFVLGQPENEIINRSNDPPPGLDRMIPGTELNNEVSINRQADGQASNTLTQQQLPRISERNLYPVPGESVSQLQRVIPGVEDDRRNVIPPSSMIQPELSITEQHREVNVEGENVEDQQHFQSHQAEITRDEPIEGANTLDDISPNNETDSNLAYDGGRKVDLSNPSTGNDDSDKDRNNYYNKTRLGDDSASIRKRNKEKTRYDTEDTDYYSDRDRRRYQREGSLRDNRSDRERENERRGSREKDRLPRDKRDSVRDRDRNKERYDRGTERDKYRDKYRYETENSKYDNENSTKYDRDSKRRYDRDEYSRRRGDDDYRRDDKERRYRRGGGGERDQRNERGGYREDSDRRRDRGGRKYEYDETYNRSGSRNANDHEKDRRYGGTQGYYTGSSGGYGGYDPYAYYQQHQQYYENLRRTNPQAYAEWYRKYYSQIQNQMTTDVMNTDGRESVHSGRSSANEKERYSRQQYYHHPVVSTSQNNQIQNSTAYLDQSYLDNISGHQSSSFVIPSRSYYTQSDFSDSRVDTTNTHLENLSNAPSNRLTPSKFINDHCIASLSNGLMVCVKPNRYFSSGNNSANIVKILTLSCNDSTRRLFNAYSGPLIRGVTHKKNVIEYCEEQIRYGPPSTTVRSHGNSISSIQSALAGQTNRSSYVLMWNLLILLLQQNGVIVGADIAELIIKNQSEFPYIQSYEKNTADSQSGRNSVQSESKRSRENDPINNDDFNPDSIDSKILSEERDIDENLNINEDEVTNKFRNYLLYGNVNKALDWATDNNLWGHALFLASKMDRRTHANIMMKFANKLELNDPLQTLFQLMSGRVPSSVTCVQDEKWGDWRSHLAMIISNRSQKPEIDRKAITTLGDTLYNRGDLFAAQFCYIMAQVNFGNYSSVNQESALMYNSMNTIRLVLLGSSHHNKNFKEFATNDAIIMTEIYEYACTLNDENFSINELQPYKYLLATRMLDYGLYMKTLMYMEQITKHIEIDPTKYSNEFIERVYTLGDRLKYYDPALEKTLEDLKDDSINNTNIIEDQKWLQNLKTILINSNQYQDNCNDIPNEYSNEITNEQQFNQNQDYIKNQIDQQFVQINQQFKELNMQYASSLSTNANQIQNQDENQLQYGGGNVQQQLQPQQQNLPMSLPPPNVNIDGGAAQYQNQNAIYYDQQQDSNNDIKMQQQQQQQQQQMPQQIDSGDYYNQQQQYQNHQGDNENYDYWNKMQQSNEPPINEPISIANNYDNNNKNNKEKVHYISQKSSLTNSTDSSSQPPTINKQESPPRLLSSYNTNLNDSVSNYSTSSDFCRKVMYDKNDMTLRKRVNFKLNNNNDKLYDNYNQSLVKCKNKSLDNQFISMQEPSSFSPTTTTTLQSVIKKPINLRNRDMCPLMISRETKIKNVVYNGTFPIDDPFSSRFVEKYDYDNTNEENYYNEENDNDDDDDDENDYDENDDGTEKHPSYSIKELIQNKTISFNYSKMRNDFEKSFMKFDQFLDRKNGRINIPSEEKIYEVRSYNIDEPL